MSKPVTSIEVLSLVLSIVLFAVLLSILPYVAIIIAHVFGLEVMWVFVPLATIAVSVAVYSLGGVNKEDKPGHVIILEDSNESPREHPRRSPRGAFRLCESCAERMQEEQVED